MRFITSLLLCFVFAGCAGEGLPDGCIQSTENPGVPCERVSHDWPGRCQSRPGDEIDWNAGALAAAKVLGCERATWQLPGETFQQAAAVYANGYVKGDCLLLLPHSRSDSREWGAAWDARDTAGRPRGTAPEYFLGYAGQFDGCECGPLVSEWPGVPVYYLSDDLHAVRLWSA